VNAAILVLVIIALTAAIFSLGALIEKAIDAMEAYFHARRSLELKSAVGRRNGSVRERVG
jgi:hypothetical protein